MSGGRNSTPGRPALAAAAEDGPTCPCCSGQVRRDVLPADELSPTQQRAMTRLREDFVSGASSSEWRATLPEVPERSFYRIQAELVRRGYVLTEGKGRHVQYRHCHLLPTSLPTEPR